MTANVTADERRKKLITWSIGFLAVANCLAWLAVWEITRPALLTVVFFDVGQGDSTLIVTPQGHQILIDGGPGSGILEKLNKEMPFWDDSLDMVVLSHPEQDHLAGLIDVLKRYKVSSVLWSGVQRDTSLFREWQKALKEEQEKDKAVIRITEAGQTISVSRSWRLEILFPFENLEGREVKDSNDTSVVMRLVFGKTAFLFTGDIPQSTEKDLISADIAGGLAVDVLKVGHHGSKTSTSEGFLRLVSPSVAVISAGRNNSYGHPHEKVLARLKDFAIKVLRTDQLGDIKIKTNGEKYYGAVPAF